MTIFNNIKRGAADAANKAAKKTGEITNIAKLTMNIKTAETKLGEVYEEIGRLFYTAERTGEECTSEIAANIMKADKIKANIAGFKKELAVLRNVTICEGCGNEIKADSAFCSYCGVKVEKAAEAETESEPEVEVDIEVEIDDSDSDEFGCCVENECDCSDCSDDAECSDCSDCPGCADDEEDKPE